jgi:phosphohistidine phosphatase SixA
MKLHQRVGAITLACAIVLASCDDDPSNSTLFQAVKAGGVVLYMRHELTESKQDAPPGRFEDCTWQRSLSDEGRRLARETGAAIALLRLPIESVIASPMCRTMETAHLVFGHATADVALRGGGKLADGSIDLSPIKQFFLRAPAPGHVIAIVGHESPGLGFQPMLKEGETAVIRPKKDGYDVIGRISSNQWHKWGKTVKT